MSLLDLAREHARECRQKSAGARGKLGGNFKKPIVSEAFAIHPDQIADFEDCTRKAGVPTSFDSEGRAQITSARHGRRLAKAYGFVHKNFG